jgi:hypothetical protein
MARLAHLMHGVRREIMQRDDAHHQRRERRRDLGVAHIGEVLLASDMNMMNFRVEGFSHLSGGAGKVDDHAAGVDHVDLEVVALKPVGELIQIAIRWAKSLSELARADPAVVVTRPYGLQILEELLEVFFFFGGPAQLEQHVLQDRVVVHGTAIMFSLRFLASVAVQLDKLSFIDILRNQLPRMAAGDGLRFGSAKRKTESEDTDCERNDSRVARHEAPFLLPGMARAGGGGRKPPVNSSQLVSEKGAANNGPRDRFLYRREKTVREFSGHLKKRSALRPLPICAAFPRN